MTESDEQFWRQAQEAGEASTKARRERRMAWLERLGREDGSIWPPETSEEDPYGDTDKDYDELD